MQSPLVAWFAAMMFWIFGPDIIRKEADDRYDFIIVGAGTAGSVVASKLSDDFSMKVLILEAGKSDIKEPRIFIPGYFPLLQQDESIIWNYTRQTSDETRSLPYTQGKVLGGSSSVNYMVYIRGSTHDYNSWEDYGAKGWNFKSIEHNFRNVEYARGKYMPDNMGKNGRVKLSNTYHPKSQLTKLVGGIAQTFGFSIGNYTEYLEGFSYTILTVYRMMRQNSATSYLRSVLPNSLRQLHILDEAHVTKILFDDQLQAYGVRYVKDGEIFTAYVDKEVIVSAGAFGSPKLLMLSGIGPKTELDKLQIPVIRDIPGVGLNYNDHPFVQYTFQTDIKLPKATSQDPEIQYLLYGSGPLVDAEYYFHFARSKYFNMTKSASNYKRPFPDIFIILYQTSSTNGTINLNALVTLAHEKSRGTVRLRSADPFAAPVIDSKFYSHPDDIDVQIDGLRLMEKYEFSEAMISAGGRFIPPTVCESLYTAKAPRSDEFYKCLIKHTASNMFHGSGTAKMGRKEDNFAVVDPKLRVYGVRNLRVADASVMPHITSANTQSPCYMIGDKAAEMIMDDWGLKATYEN